ncbi:MAG: NAD(+)/NADH kinase [Bacteroidota bacterium]
MKFGIAGNLEKPVIAEVVESLLTRFEKEDVQYVLHDTLARGLKKRKPSQLVRKSSTVSESGLAGACDILISLGGDGTILRMARIVGKKRTPILGINVGKLGFLAEISVEELDECLSEILAGRYHIEDRMVLQATSSKMKSDYFALNDVVMDLSSSSRMLSIETFVNGEFLSTFTGDGMIVCTPTGSTGYALSNGGPILSPSNRSMMISPICPHALTVRPVVIPDDCVVTLKVQAAPGRVHVTTDGQPEVFLKPPLEVKVKRAGFTTRLVKRSNTSYFEVLRRKLHWGHDLRSSPSDM